ncbi:PDR/VanB family oxidoreductase [Oceanobacter sp. 3_MG-2023]|uniref:PDR/VanB family oxidoreductase n=1 Tax=Oceanobacter sp. 3_MG-2023 TaxID=3062622 RepID=UPI002734D681|nr:PDR/VanB family oxidoreductase [Oceanobacter sp. 3_MG-2023]MDP2506371.1 PDR/VanB family oxidoreductase [Oceanobacter sp. 3_MG-2023]
MTITVTGNETLAPGFCLHLTVNSKAVIADGIIKLLLAGEELPDWEPGAHIELAFPGGLVRAYSIVSGEPGRSYELAILLEPESRGGSRYVHEQVQEGDVIAATKPKNSFALEAAENYAFIAGGIGITPVLPMIRSMKRAGKPWKLYYLGRSRTRMAYMAEVEALEREQPGSVFVHIDDEVGGVDLGVLVNGLAENTAVYTCGPNGLMDALSVQIEQRPSISLHMERFGRIELVPLVDAAAISDDATDAACDVDGAFELELHKTGETINVGKDETILDCVRKVRQGLSFSCSDGYCGTCETAVLGGIPDHRDTVLSEQEREENRTMMICVSRSKTRKLILDL